MQLEQPLARPGPGGGQGHPKRPRFKFGEDWTTQTRRTRRLLGLLLGVPRLGVFWGASGSPGVPRGASTPLSVLSADLSCSCLCRRNQSWLAARPEGTRGASRASQSTHRGSIGSGVHAHTHRRMHAAGCMPRPSSGPSLPSTSRVLEPIVAPPPPRQPPRRGVVVVHDRGLNRPIALSIASPR